MKQLNLLLLILCFSFVANAQEKFEITANAKMGYYFPGLKKSTLYSPKNAVSPGLGVSFNYLVFGKTSLSLGVGGSFLSPSMVDFYREPIDVRWHTLDVPFEIKQGFGKSFFVAGGVTLKRQFTGYWKNQEIPEYNWQIGSGWKFKELRLSLYYTSGFKQMEKMTKLTSNSWSIMDIKHREFFLKVEYPLWKF